MTTPMLPDFIISLFEDELKKIIRNILDHISTECHIDKQQLEHIVENKLNMPLHVITQYEEVIKIQKIKPRSIPTEENRCIARTYKNGIFDRCMCSKKKGEFCKRHLYKHDHGTIHDDHQYEHVFKACKKLY